MKRPDNIRPPRVGDIVRVWGFTHEPGLYMVRSLGAAMATISPLREDGRPASFAQGADYANLILHRDGDAHTRHLVGNT